MACGCSCSKAAPLSPPQQSQGSGALPGAGPGARGGCSRQTRMVELAAAAQAALRRVWRPRRQPWRAHLKAGVCLVHHHRPELSAHLALAGACKPQLPSGRLLKAGRGPPLPLDGWRGDPCRQHEPGPGQAASRCEPAAGGGGPASVAARASRRRDAHVRMLQDLALPGQHSFLVVQDASDLLPQSTCCEAAAASDCSAHMSSASW